MDEADPSYAKIMGYIDRNPAAVLSTVGDDGPYGAVVYVVPASHSTLCFVTKNKTQKYANLTEHPVVSLTFFNEREGTTLQTKGNAYTADDPGLKNFVLDKTSKSHAVRADWLPPVTTLDAGEYVVIGVELTYARLAEYQGLGITGPTFTELRKA